MPHRNLLLTLILTAGVTPFLTPGQAQAQPGAGSPPLGKPGQTEGSGDGGRGGNAGGPGQPATPGTGGRAGNAGDAGSANDSGAEPGAAVPQRTAPPL